MSNALLEHRFELSKEDFGWIQEQIRTRTGIVIAEHKRDLVYNRMSRRLRNVGLKTFSDYRNLIDSNEREFIEFINALTTNVTSFFRESHHFELLKKKILPEIVNTPSARARIWSAGCSSGQEPYSIAMTVASAFRSPPRNLKILATDLDTNVIKKARSGVYPLSEVEGIGAKYLSQYFNSQGVPQGAVQAKPVLRNMIRFNQLNLMQNWPMQGKFDVIFCRNVIIYFDRETQQKLFNRYASVLNPGGYLFLGHSESINGNRNFQPLGKTAFKKVT